MKHEVVTTAKAQPVQRPPRYLAETLTKGGALAQIQHGDQLYTLRITRGGKLLLTK